MVLRNLLAVVVEVDRSHMDFGSVVGIDAAALALETTTSWRMGKDEECRSRRFERSSARWCGIGK